MSNSHTISFPRGSEWRKWDLHVHTRLDHNYHCLDRNSLSDTQVATLVATTGLTEADIKSREKEITAAQYAKLFVSYIDKYTDVDVVAITNHNSGEELDEIIAAASITSRHISVIPGVEVCSTQGIHMLCLFDPNTPWFATWHETIDHFLT